MLLKRTFSAPRLTAYSFPEALPQADDDTPPLALTTERRVAKFPAKAALEAQPVLKQNSLAFDVRTAAEEKCPEVGRVIAAVVEWVESEKDFAAGREMSLQIVQQKIPFRRSPAFLRRMVKIEIDRERRDPIERLTKIRQRLECIDPPN